MIPCTFNVRRLTDKVKEGSCAAGGTPMEFDTIAIRCVDDLHNP